MILGKQVRLRALGREDLDLLFVWWNDPALWELIGSRKRMSPYEELENWFDGEIEKGGPNDGRTFAIDDGNDLLGTCWYAPYDSTDRQSTVGLYLGHPENRGKGLGREALRLLLSYLFEELGLHKARLHVAADNEPAIRAYHALGFVEEGRLREHRFYGGRFHDFLSMGLLAREFRSQAD